MSNGAFFLVQTEPDLTRPSIASKAFVPLAIEAGLPNLIKSKLPLALSDIGLLKALKADLVSTNFPLAEALTVETLNAVLDYMQTIDNTVVKATELPEVLNQDGPASVSAARDGGVTTQINITFTAQPSGFDYEIYMDSLFQKKGSNAPSAGFTSDTLSGVAAGSHTIRVLYVRQSDDALTRFGPIANIPS